MAQVAKPGTVSIEVVTPSFTHRFSFRAKRIPDPTPFVGSLRSGEKMEAAAFKASGGVGLLLLNFDYEAQCRTEQYDIIRVTDDGDREQVQNNGARFGPDARALIEKATPRDLYLFKRIRASCPGDPAIRSLPNFFVEIR